MTTENLGTLVAKFELDTSAANKAAGAAKSTLGDLERSTDRTAAAAKTAHIKFGPLASAINGVTSAAGAANPMIARLGASATGLAATFAAGGPLGLALAGIGVAVGLVASKFSDAMAELDKVGDALENGFVARATAAREVLDGLRGDLAAFGKDARTLQAEGLLSKETEARSALAAAESSLEAIQKRSWTPEEGMEGYILKVNESKIAVRLLRGEINTIVASQGALVALAGKEADARQKSAKAYSGEGAGDDMVARWRADQLEDAKALAAAIEKSFQNSAIYSQNIKQSLVDTKVQEWVNAMEATERAGESFGGMLAELSGAGPMLSKVFGEAGKGIAGGGGIGSVGSAVSGLGAAGGASLALELFKAGYDGIVQGFTAVAEKIGQFDSRMGGALGAAAPLAGAAVVTGGGLLTAPLAPALAGAAVATAFLELSKNTESYARTQATVQRAVDKVVNALEPFWQNVGQASGIMVKVAEVLAPAIAGFAGSTGELLGEGLFRIAQGLGAAISLSAAGVYKLGETSWTVVSSMQGAAAALLDLVPGMGDMAKTYRERAAASLSAANANEIAASEAMKTLDEILSAKYGEMLDPATQAVKDFTTALQDATYNIPTWYRAASAVSDRAPAQAAGAGGAISMQVMRSRGYVSPSNWSGRG